jgi:ELWxxDGT repeat protein
MARMPRRMLPVALYLALVCALIAPSYVPARLAVAAGAANGPATLVKDMNPGSDATPSSSPDKFITIGNTTYFVATDSSNGREIWKTDGTAEGTTLVVDVTAGAGNSFPDDGYPPIELTHINGTLFFATGSKLWKSDGSSAGTRLVKNFTVPSNTPTIKGLTISSGFVYFDVNTELWRSDGTEAGTIALKALHPISVGLQQAESNGTLFFSDSDQLWKSDGSLAGTVLVKDIRPVELLNVNGTLFFGTDDSKSGTGLWKSDGSPTGTVKISDTPPSLGLTHVNGTVFFTTGTLWKSDGTPAGTVPVGNAHNVTNLTAVGDKLFFVALGSSGYELWKSDGTDTGTLRVKDLRPEWTGDYFYSLTNVNGILFFVTDDRVSNGFVYDLWKSDGTEGGTSIVGANWDFGPRNLANANGALLFAGYTVENGTELWQSDGTASGTRLLADINILRGNSIPSQLVDFRHTLFFVNADTSGSELWKSDGTANGTTQVKDITPGAAGSDPDWLTIANGSLFFVAHVGDTSTDLWKTDGTAQGTVRVKALSNAGTPLSPSDLTAVSNMLFFTAGDGGDRRDLWKSDGTEAGTVILKHFNSAVGNFGLNWMTDVNDTLYFNVDDGIHGRELWRSDGTELGTVLVKDINPGAASATPSLLTNVNGTLFFTADNGSEIQLWKSDGTAAGTVPVKDIIPGTPDPYITSAVDVDGILFFVVWNSQTSQELWKSDGTTAGTVPIKNIEAFALTAVNDTLFFIASDGQDGWALWKSDGSSAGTVQITDFAPSASRSLSLSGLTPLPERGSVLFRASEGVSGIELWQSNGVSIGTFPIQDIAHGAGSSSPALMTVVDAQIFFVADDNLHGKELWSLPTTSVAPSGRAQITPDAGGSATFGNIDLSFPPGAVTTPITISYSGLVTPTQSLGGMHSAGPSFTLEARDSAGRPVTHFAQPYTLVISYTDEELAALGINEQDLNLAFWNGSAWVNVLPCAGCGVDTVNNRLTAVLDHFTEFALLSGNGERRVYLPLTRR